MSKKDVRSGIVKLILIVIMIVIIFKLYEFYKKYNYTEFIKAEKNLGITTFTRDKEIKYKYDYSYKLESKEFNDAIFYKGIEVKPDTPYKLTCMIKTEDVELEDKMKEGGAQICILDTLECSRKILGTHDWQELDFIFNSKDRKKVNIGFSLGGNETNAKGSVWFSDFKLEEGIKDESTNWNVVCFIMKYTDINIDNENLKFSMNLEDVKNIKMDMERFKTSANVLSNGMMTVDYDIYEIDEPVTKATYSDEYGYYIDPSNVKDIIEEYLLKEEYDYIFLVVRLGDKHVEIPVNGWIGLRRDGFKWNRIFKYKIT